MGWGWPYGTTREPVARKRAGGAKRNKARAKAARASRKANR